MRCVPFASSELFSEPQLNLQPTEVFENEEFRMHCNTVLYAIERINVGMLQYSIYRDNVRVTTSNSLRGRAYESSNGHYTCQVQILSASFVKKSQTVVLKAKGELRETLGTFVTLWCFYFGRWNDSCSYMSFNFYGGILQSRDKK